MVFCHGLGNEPELTCDGMGLLVIRTGPEVLAESCNTLPTPGPRQVADMVSVETFAEPVRPGTTLCGRWHAGDMASSRPAFKLVTSIRTGVLARALVRIGSLCDPLDLVFKLLLTSSKAALTFGAPIERLPPRMALMLLSGLGETGGTARVTPAGLGESVGGAVTSAMICVVTAACLQYAEETGV